MGVYTHSNGNWLSRRGGFLVILVAFHVLMFWALKSGFAIEIVKAITAPIKVEIIEEVKIEEPPPPPPEVQIEIPKIQVPPILVDIPNPPDPPPTVIIAPTTPDPVPPPPSIPPKVEGSGTKIAPPSNVTKASYAFRPNPEDYYPNAARTRGEEGALKIRLCYDEKGKVLASTVAESSKFPDLDAAGIKLGKATKIKPGTRDGKAQADCVVMPVRFSLKGEQ